VAFALIAAAGLIVLFGLTLTAAGWLVLEVLRSFMED